VAQQLVLVIKVAAKHFGWLVDSMLDLDSDASSGLWLLDNLKGFKWDIESKLEWMPTSCVLWLISSEELQKRDIQSFIWNRLNITHIFPRSIISFLPVVGSIFTTARGVPTRNVPSKMSTPRMMGSLLANAAMILRRHGQTAWGAASFRLASVISWLYALKESKRW